MSQNLTHTAADREAQLRTLGYEPGYPPHVAPMARAVDASTARKMVCGCGRRGLGCKPYHKGRSFRVVSVCPTCNASMEI